MEDELHIPERKIGAIMVLDLKGKVTGGRAQALESKLEDLRGRGENNIVLNFQEVLSIDSLGADAISRGTEAGSRIMILHPASCREILQQYRLTDRVKLLFREEDALKSFSSPSAAHSERRQFKRIPVNHPIEIEYQDHKRRGVMLNFSEEGALLGYLDPLKPKPAIDDSHPGNHHLAGSLRFSFKLGPLVNIELSGTPVSFRQNSEMYTVGIQILHSERSRHLLQKMVDDPESFFPPQA